jgi:hypothetical protein
MNEKEILREHLSRLGKKGGKKGGTNRMASLTPKQRSALAKKAATARWGEKQDGSLKVHGDSLDTPKQPPQKKKAK